MDIAPDLSHLTEDERKIIEAVINRQKAEEKRDAEALQSRFDDYSAPVAMAGRRYSQQVRNNPSHGSSNETGVCCEVCQKTKFVGEQSSRQCSVCKKRFCVRCGVRLKGHQYNKTFWLCNICRQKQESYFSSRKLIPTTSSVSQLTSTSGNNNNINDENTSSISKQYVSDYILSQPFDNQEEVDLKIKSNGAKKQVTPQRKRMLPTAHLQQQPAKETKHDSSSEQDDGALSSPDSASAIDDTESVPRGHMLANDIWQKEEILAAKLENFLTTPTTTWRWNENHTEQIGYVHLKNHTWTPTIRDEYQQGKRGMKGDIFSALGLKIQGGMEQEIDDGSINLIAEITKVTPGSIADSIGQLQIGDQVLEWNGQKLINQSANDVYRIISENSMQSADIHLVVKRSNRYSTLASNEQSLPTPPNSNRTSEEHDPISKKTTTTNENKIRLQLAFQYQYHQRELIVIVYGARDVHMSTGAFACQLFLQYGRDSLSKERKCTKPQICSAGVCTWNQRLTFFDIDTLDHLSIWIRFVDLDRNEDILGEICIPLNEKTLNLTGTPDWFSLSSHRTKEFIRSDSDISEIDQHGSSFNRVLPTTNPSNDLLSSTIDNASASQRKRQLPNIPVAQLHANREKVSQDLIQKATQLKLRLHMQQQQRSFNENTLNEKRQMYEDRIQIFNNEATRVNPSSSNSQRGSFQSSKSIDTDSPHLHPMPLPSKAYESMNNLAQNTSSTTNLKEKTSSRPKIPIIRDKTVPQAPHLNPALSRRTTSAGQQRAELERSKLKSFEDKYRKNQRKREPSETPGDDVDSDGSELSTVSKISSVSMLSTQSERPRATRKHIAHTRMHEHHNYHRNDEVQLNEEELRQMAMRTHDTIVHPSPSTKSDAITTAAVATHQTIPTTNKSMNLSTTTTGTTKVDPRNDGTVSDSVLSNQTESNKKRRPSMSSKALVILGLSKKTNSASNLGYGKRYGFQRSEEVGVQPHLRSRTLQRQTSKENETPSSAPAQSPLVLSHQREQYHSMPHDMKLWSGGLKLPHEHQFTEFIDNLGAGQLVGRQVLASPCHGEIQVGVRDQHGLLEVEIVRARNLLQKALYKMPPAPYVKVYLLDGKTCMEKQRTRTTRRTLDPLIQQTLIFKENYRDKVLQIGVWGDYGKLDRKVFMGVCQINLEDLHLHSSAQVLDWYRLFSANSLMNNYTIVQQSPKKTTSMTSQDSFNSFKTNSR